MVEVSPPTTTGRTDYGQETLPNAKMVEASPDGRGLPTDYHGQDGLRSGDLAQRGSGEGYGRETLPNSIADRYPSDTKRRTRIISSRRSRTIPGFSRPAAFSNQIRARCLSPSLRWHNPT